MKTFSVVFPPSHLEVAIYFHFRLTFIVVKVISIRNFHKKAANLFDTAYGKTKLSSVTLLYFRYLGTHGVITLLKYVVSLTLLGSIQKCAFYMYKLILYEVHYYNHLCRFGSIERKYNSKGVYL